MRKSDFLGYQLLSEFTHEMNTFMHSDKTMLQIFKYNHEDKTFQHMLCNGNQVINKVRKIILTNLFIRTHQHS